MLEQIKTTEDFPKVMHKPYLVDCIEYYENKLKEIQVSSYKSEGEYKMFLEKEYKKITGFIDFLSNKIKEIDEKRFEEATKNDILKELKSEGKLSKQEEKLKEDFPDTKKDIDFIEKTIEKIKPKRKRKSKTESKTEKDV